MSRKPVCPPRLCQELLQRLVTCPPHSTSPQRPRPASLHITLVIALIRASCPRETFTFSFSSLVVLETTSSISPTGQGSGAQGKGWEVRGSAQRDSKGPAPEVATTGWPDPVGKHGGVGGNRWQQWTDPAEEGITGELNLVFPRMLRWESGSPERSRYGWAWSFANGYQIHTGKRMQRNLFPRENVGMGVVVREVWSQWAWWGHQGRTAVSIGDPGTIPEPDRALSADERMGGQELVHQGPPTHTHAHTGRTVRARGRG